jgi:hypothetical protein
MEDSKGRRARFFSEVASLQQQGSQTAGRTLECDGDAVDSAPDHNEIKRLLLCVRKVSEKASSGWRGVRRQFRPRPSPLPRGSRMRSWAARTPPEDERLPTVGGVAVSERIAFRRASDGRGGNSVSVQSN